MSKRLSLIMLFFKLHAFLFFIFGAPVFAIPVRSPPEDGIQAKLATYYKGIKFSVPKDIRNITLHRLIDSHTLANPKLANDALHLEEIHGSQSVWVGEVPFDQPNSLRWQLKAVNFQVDYQVRRVSGWWLAFSTSPNEVFKCGILVHVQFKQEQPEKLFEAKYFDLEPRIVGKLEEVSRLSDIKGYWYAPTAHFSGISAPIAGRGIVQVVDDEKLKVWDTLTNPGVLQGNQDVVPIKEPRYHDIFKGCWIRYPLRDISLEQRREVVCVIQGHDTQWKTFRGTWEVDTSKVRLSNNAISGVKGEGLAA